MAISRRRFLSIAGGAAAVPLLPGCGGVDKLPAEGVPRSSFDENATAEEVTDGVDLRGKTAVVTGCTSGIGFETMRVLAMRGAYVLGTSRSLERAQDACNKVVGVTSPLALELSDFESVVRCADQLRSLNTPIDILVCNAGYRGGGNDRQLVQGIEKHFLINHLGHFVLVNRIVDRMYFAHQGRIVVVASRTSYTDAPETGIEFDNFDARENYGDARAYGHSKLANVLFSYELGRRLRGTRITSNALHPGLINTEIDRHLSRLTQFGFGILTAVSGKTIAEGAATSCFVATSPLLESTSGAYFEDCNAVTIVGNANMRNDAMSERLWQVSEELTQDYIVTHEAPDSSFLKKQLRINTE